MMTILSVIAIIAYSSRSIKQAIIGAVSSGFSCQTVIINQHFTFEIELKNNFAAQAHLIIYISKFKVNSGIIRRGGAWSQYHRSLYTITITSVKVKFAIPAFYADFIRIVPF